MDATTCLFGFGEDEYFRSLKVSVGSLGVLTCEGGAQGRVGTE